MEESNIRRDLLMLWVGIILLISLYLFARDPRPIVLFFGKSSEGIVVSFNEDEFVYEYIMNGELYRGQRRQMKTMKVTKNGKIALIVHEKYPSIHAHIREHIIVYWVCVFLGGLLLVPIYFTIVFLKN